MSKPLLFQQLVSATEPNQTNVSIGNATINKDGTITGTILQTTGATNKAGKFATINNGQIYYREPAEVLADIGAAAETSINNLSTEITTLKTSDSTLKDNLTDLETNYQTLNNSVSSLKTANTTTATKLDTLQTQQTSISEDLKTLSNTMSTTLTKVFSIGTTAPTDTKLLWIDTTSNSGLKYYNGSAWVTMPVCWGE